MPAITAVLTYISVFYNYLADLTFFEVNFTIWQYIGMAVTLGFSLAPAVIRLQKE